MMKLSLMGCFLFLSINIFAQHENNPNWAELARGCSAEASSSNFNKPNKVLTSNLNEGWNSDGETVGAWISLKFRHNRQIKEIWIRSKPTSTNSIAAKKISISFSDSTTVNAELRVVDYFQIIRLPMQKETDFMKITVKELWSDTGSGGTGIGKVRVFSKDHDLSFSIRPYEMYDAINKRPVKLAEVKITNPGDELTNAHIVFSKDQKQVEDIQLETIAARSETYQKMWTTVPDADGESEVVLFSGNEAVTQPIKLITTSYRETYFEGGKFLIHSTNHNDLGWLDTQLETANYRSKELILPAMKIMEKSPDFTYTMESIEYLKEFLARHPERRSEMEKLVREKRFSWGASYVQMLQAHVGPENLVRQFYYGRRWLKENISGADTRTYMNADVPMVTYQLPQILRSAGIEYMVQGRIPLGFYYWQGLDGTTIPTYGIRYGSSPMIFPQNNDEWLRFTYKQERYYKSHNLPKVIIYDHNNDYLPPCGDFVSYVKEQNESMRQFSSAWNDRHKDDKAQHVQPPVLSFTNPQDMLKEVFGDPHINLETIKGDWPCSWAYYDEPSNREALLVGRKAHNLLLSAEKIFSSLRQIHSSVDYPKVAFDSAWMANCWPDHGWGGNKGLTSDSVYRASYEKSYAMAQSLVQQSLKMLCKKISSWNDKHIPLVVYNSLNWNRTEPVRCTFALPNGWYGFDIKNKNGTTIPFELVERKSNQVEIIFVAEDVPSSGYTTYYIAPSKDIQSPVRPLSGDSIDTGSHKLLFGKAGIKQYTDKINERSYFRTDKFQAGEVLQFSAPGNAWDDGGSLMKVNMDDFDKSGNHESVLTRFIETPIRYVRETETQMKDFNLRQRFIVLKKTEDIEMEIDISGWNGAKNKELRVAFPFNLERKNVEGLTTVPAKYLRTPDGKNSGLLGEYFDNIELRERPVFSKVDTNMALYWGLNSPGEGIPEDFFSVGWSGTISSPETGNYMLGMITDDKGRLYFEDKLVIDNWDPCEANVLKTFRTNMEKGREYKIRIEYGEVTVYAGMRFQWKKVNNDAKDLAGESASSYEVPFGTVDYKKDEIDFSQWPDNQESQFHPQMYGGTNQIAFREALDWVNVSTGAYKGYGCLLASDMTVHLFEDQTSDPVSYPVVQHVLLSTRKSLAWNPEYWFDQKGNHSYRMALYFHDGNWRMRYRDGIAFNYPLIAYVPEEKQTNSSFDQTQSFLSVQPSNIVVTATKQSEDGKGTVIRFYEAEGKQCTATLALAKPIKEAFRTNLLEYEPVALPSNPDGTISVSVKPWEILTIVIRN